MAWVRRPTSYPEAIRLEAIRLRQATGLSCSQIAKQLGHGLTKNKVVGICARAGLSDPANSPIKYGAKRKEKPAKKAPALPASTGGGFAGNGRAAQAKGGLPCLWPQVDPKRDAVVCEKQAIKRGEKQMPYCEDHCTRAYHASKG